MEENIQTKPSVNQIRYERLDKYLLFLVIVELGYAVLLGLVFAVLAIFDNTTNLHAIIYQNRIEFIRVSALPFLPLAAALLLNMIGGFASAVLHIASKRQGYPGTGHFVNWLVCVTHFWVIILAILVFVDNSISSS